jgi:hypothetical protein
MRAMQILLGHTKIESTVRYLGVDIEDALALAEGTGGLVSDGLPCLNAEGSTSIPRTSAKRRVRSPLAEVRRVLPTGRTLKDAYATRRAFPIGPEYGRMRNDRTWLLADSGR